VVRLVLERLLPILWIGGGCTSWRQTAHVRLAAISWLLPQIRAVQGQEQLLTLADSLIERTGSIAPLLAPHPSSVEG
jgi:hypothetical protein